MEGWITNSMEERRDEYEHCVHCRRRLSIKRSTHIDMRPEYIIGVGDLCYECYKALQIQNKSEVSLWCLKLRCLASESLL